MNCFGSAREAKEFLISRIVEEAQRESVVLSEPERKMLYFSETGWTLPDMSTVAKEFDSTHDWKDYEKKIARLIRNAAKRARKQSPADYDDWSQAILRLKKEDHYILVMIRQAGLRPRGDVFRLWGTGIVIVTVLVALIFLSIRYGIDLGKYMGRGIPLGPYIWASALLVAIACQLLGFFMGAKRVDDWTSRLVQKVVRLRAR
ncbi:MAG TPA: hypothetical protein VEK33_09720 [Terriglobales bacterium]|nr:hypothetical protein [Terriglobales bacterium]